MSEITHKLLISKGHKPRKGIIKNCKFCGTEFYLRQSLKARIFCSSEHSIKWQKDNAFHFPCVICQIEIYTQPTQIKYRNRKTCSIKCRGIYIRKMAEKRRIDLGYTKHQLDRLARYSPESKFWRKAVFERDNYTCVECGLRSGNGKSVILNADHIKPFAFFPQSRFDINNGRTLCIDCHNKTKINHKKMREKYCI